MDTFMDRFSHRRNSQEMIQANSAADAARMEQLKQQIAEYDTLLQDMRKVNLKAAENMEQMQKVLQEGFDKIDAVKVQDDFMPEIKKQIEELMQQGNDTQSERETLLSEMKTQLEELLPQIKKQMDESFQRSDDFLHRENVKVYRNVQAAMTEELEKRTNVLTQKQDESIRKQKALLPVSVVIMLMVIADIIINLFNIIIKF